MKNKDFKIPLIIALTYWIPSSIVLVRLFNGWEILIPSWLDKILIPGYILGFTLGYGGGNSWAFIGQIITLIILSFVIGILYLAFKKN